VYYDLPETEKEIEREIKIYESHQPTAVVQCNEREREKIHRTFSNNVPLLHIYKHYMCLVLHNNRLNRFRSYDDAIDKTIILYMYIGKTSVVLKFSNFKVIDHTREQNILIGIIC